MRPSRVFWGVTLAAVVVALGLFFYAQRRMIPPPPPAVGPPPPAPLAVWPWPHATQATPSPGVTHWWDTSSPDGTALDLFEFDFAANPRLRLELYDQDEDDATPGDNRVDYWPQGVGQATRHLNARGRGPVLAAWNGLFFNSTVPSDGPRAFGAHVAPVVLRGRALYHVGDIRWAFGVQYDAGRRPTFKVLHEPDKATLAREFTWAAEGAQCLIRDGQALRLQPYPRIDEPAPRQPVPSTPDETGFVPFVDHIQTSRTTMGWSRDSQEFYLLVAKTATPEGDSVAAFQHRASGAGGWTVADEQRFWQALGAWGAVNIDGGDVTMLTARRADGNYDMVPPLWADRRMRLRFTPQFNNAPTGGTMMYFYVRELRH